ncbi:IgGFc-binding protein-like [Alligator sinensis]|uniref:IgGFc-binding protein-like n=1 Tax=Alligator sinensis TaxID=38654 RepID=A0A1U8DMA7_ALLSI|nr:IgGFc-binding protein-like [Alligator sinensis]
MVPGLRLLLLACLTALCGAQRDGTCSVTGNSHYLTFDGHRFTFQGSCWYQLAGACGGVRPGLADFRVLIRGDPDAYYDGSFIWAVEVQLGGLVVLMNKESPREVMVNGALSTLPFISKDGSVSVSRQGLNGIIQTPSGLTITFDWSSWVAVTAPAAYAGTLCGLCGNFNGDPGDDLSCRDGTAASDPLTFGESWKEKEVEECSEFENQECLDHDLERKQRGDKEGCGILMDEGGPFQACHSHIDPKGYFQDCVLDYCLHRDQEQTCSIVASYAVACQVAGVTLQSWRTSNHCLLSCPLHSHYELCTRTCEAPCPGLGTPAGCSTTCREGCYCDSGYAADGADCVPREACRCFYGGRRLEAGETVVAADCSETCTCRSTGGLACEAWGCPPGQICTHQAGAPTCISENGECQLAPGAQFTSFDGAVGPAPSRGAYVMASLCNASTPSWFRVVVHARGPEAPTWAPGVVVHGFFGDSVITLRRDNKAWVNGRLAPLPAQVSDAVSVSESKGKVTIAQNSGVRVQLSSSGDVTVTVAKGLASQLCAACGDFDGDASDDLQLPGGRIAGTITEVIQAWRARDFSACMA